MGDHNHGANMRENIGILLILIACRIAQLGIVTLKRHRKPKPKFEGNVIEFRPR